MKEHNIDKLFREKLQEHSVAPTPAAWEQLAGNLKAGRRKRGGYYAAAAAVVLLLLLSWVGLRLGEGVDPFNGKQQPTVAVQEQAAQPSFPESVETGTSEPIREPAAPAETVEQSAAPAPLPQTESAQLAAAAPINAAPKANIAESLAVEKQESEPALQPEVLEITPETALAQELPLAPEKQEESLALSPVTNVLPSANVALASTEQVVIRYDASNTEETPKDKDRDNASEKVLSLMKKVKQGEIGLADIRKAKDNLLSGRFNKP